MFLRFMNKLKIICALGIAALMVSCRNTKIAKDVEGTWTTTYQTVDELGETSNDDVTFVFKYKPSGDDEDGTFIEHRTSKYSDSDGTLTYNSNIGGRYSVISGDIYLTYDLATLHTSVDVLQNGNAYDYDGLDWNDRWELQNEAKKEMEEQKTLLRNDLTKALSEEYTNCNDIAYSLEDVKLDGNTLKCKSEFYGDLTMTKILSSGDNYDSGKASNEEVSNEEESYDDESYDEELLDTLPVE